MKLLVALTLLMTLTACSYHEVKTTGGGAGLGQNPPKPGLDFEAVKTQIFTNPNSGKCSACHGWASNYADIKAKIFEIQRRVNLPPGSPGFMPKDNSALTAEQKELLNAWVSTGAPETVTDGGGGGDGGGTTPTPQPVEMNWDSISRNIIQPYCVKCHTEADFTNDDTKLVTYEDVFNHRKDVRKEVVRREMPRDTRLPDELLIALIEWIDQGLPR